MLTKLLKYELMAEWKKYAIIFGGMVFLALSLLVLNKGFLSGENYIVEMVFELVLGAFVMLCIFALFIIFVFSTIRFYKNMFRDEGYLMNTLPCTVGQHLGAKIAATYIWAAATALLIFICIGIAVGDFMWVSKAIEAAKTEIAELRADSSEAVLAELDMVFTMFKHMGIYLAASLVLMPALYQIYLNFCIAVGSLFNTYKILMAVVTFVGVNVVSQAISTVAMFIMGYSNVAVIMESDEISSVSEMMPMINFLDNVYIFTGVFCVVLYGAMLWATHYIMSKKLNLA
ncbi:MAG: hypothetical protein IJZ72_07670 [Oscillospiraceae bacterium]|nr:hypothetical protein [Oscillospiraceae bacterium]